MSHQPVTRAGLLRVLRDFRRDRWSEAENVREAGNELQILEDEWEGKRNKDPRYQKARSKYNRLSRKDREVRNKNNQDYLRLKARVETEGATPEVIKEVRKFAGLK